MGDGQPVLAVRRYAEERRLLYVEDTITNVQLIAEILRRRPSVELAHALTGRIGPGAELWAALKATEIHTYPA